MSKFTSLLGKLNYQFLISVLPQVLNACIALVTVRIYSEILTPNQLGQVMLILGFLALLDALFSASVSQSIFYFACKPHGILKILPLFIYIQRRCIWFPPAALVIAVLVLVTNEDTKNNFFYWISFSFLVISYLIVESMRSAYAAILNSAQLRAAYGAQIVIDAIFMLVTTSILLLYKSNIFSLVFGVVMARSMSFMFARWLVQNNFSKNREKVKKLSTFEVTYKLRDLVIYAFPFVAMGAVGWATSFADRYAVAWIGGTATAGVYAVTSGLMGRPFNILSASLTTHFRPGLYANVASNNFNVIKKIQTNWIVSALVAGILCDIFVWIFVEEIVNVLLAAEYRVQGIKLIPIFGLVLTATIITHAFDNKIMAKGGGSRLLSLQILCIPITLCGLIFGTIFGGPTGTVWGRLASELIRLTAVIIFSVISEKNRMAKK